MNIPFLDLFQKARGRLFPSKPAAAPAPVHRVAPEKRTGLRLSKTVLPNTTRTSTPDPFKLASDSPGRQLSGFDMPPAVALALEPKVERAISLQLGDIFKALPGDCLRSTENFDAERIILLRATEIEKGMSAGKPTVSLAAVYEQAPEIFVKTILPDDCTQIPLPYEKVLEQFNNLQVRGDQLHDQNVPQVETPFLQVTIEDTERFGTSVAHLQASAIPPVKVEPATAKTISKAEPEPAVQQKARSGWIPKRPSTGPASKNHPGSPPKTKPSASPTRIPFQLPPNGAGVPASERVPASSGPPVPTPSTPPPSGTVTPPPKIPFKIPAPSADVRPKFTLVPGVDPKDSGEDSDKAEEQRPDDRKITLGLQAVMQNIPAFQLNGSPSEIAADARVELPYVLIEHQLASGRVAIDPKTFQAAIPEKYRQFFVVDPTETPVLLPLQEVLKNIPETALQMRKDQEKEESADYFETPFSIRADEDKRRLRGGKPAVPESGSAPAAKPQQAAEKSAAPKSALPEKTEAAATPAPEAPEGKAEAKAEPEKKVEANKPEKNEAKSFLERAGALPGVASCAITFADGLTIAGNLPREIEVEGLCAMAPSVLQKIYKHTLETKLGSFNGMTLHCSKSTISFFMQGNVCLSVLHCDRQLGPETQDQLAGIVKEISRVYTQPDTAHVDH